MLASTSQQLRPFGPMRALILYIPAVCSQEAKKKNIFRAFNRGNGNKDASIAVI